MGDFLEFIRQQHFKIHGSPDKKKKTAANKLADDSVSDITDLSKEGILNSSMALLPHEEQKIMKKYNEKFNKMLNGKMKAHDCYRIDRKI